MNRSEYEKLCDEAFGKPERQSPRRLLKKYKKLAICAAAVLVLAVAVLAICLLHEQDPYVHREVRKPVFLQVQSRQEDSFYGVGLDGLLWLVNYDMRMVDDPLKCCWIRFEGEPTMESGDQPAFAVSADSCWTVLLDERARFGYCYDICEFDIDRDGIVEQCVLGSGGTTGVSSFELSVWDGDVCEDSVMLFPKEHDYCLAFYTDGQELRIAGIRKGVLAYYEAYMDVAYSDGKLEVLTEGVAIDTFPVPANNGQE